MSDTPEAPKRATYEPGPEAEQTGAEQASGEQVAPAAAPAASAAAEPQDTGPQVVEPPSNPVSARGHINSPEEEQRAQAAAVPATPAEPARPAAIAEPEPVVSSEDDVAAAVARSSAQPGATAGGDATVDTASPVESATPVIVAAEAANARQADTATTAYGTVPAGEATATGVAAGAAAAVAAPGPQPVAPIYLQRPEPPKKKSNRGVGILIALVGTIAFAILWAAAVLVVGSLLTPSNEFLPALLQFFTGGLRGWVPVVAFFVGMVVLIQILNRARWWAYILGGLFVAIFVYFSFIGASLVDAEYWRRTPEEFAVFLRNGWVNPFAVLAGVIAREISIWTGAWLAARGRKLKARNAEAQADYDQQVADAQNQAVAAYAQQGY